MISSTNIADLKASGISRISLAIGIFDGVHIGHQKIIENLKTCAESTSSEAVILTFHPNPLKILRPEIAPPMLISLKHKELLLKRRGISAIVTLPFTRDLSLLSPEEFIQTVIVDSGVDIQSITVGSRWRFGFKASGDLQLLKSLGEKFNFTVSAVGEDEDSESIISSTRIRKCVQAGDIDGTEALLGRPFSIYGKVNKGRGIATEELRYPTANIMAENEISPPLGIYASNAIIDGQKYPGILYLGNSPTYFENAPATPFVEIHIFDFDANIYGQMVEIEFIEFIRGDEKFDCPEDLRKQISNDIEKAHIIHKMKG
ncbi:MAG: riboflavin biosynthesis protein RibF [Lentisphaeria bacterium]|nr:riboflavin biosynthesis protein RibF [Lentisphaeria bacterium]NQZ69586.1 riboflavin biosynthesis protein RibF [Lentisphaeria bacterium]